MMVLQFIGISVGATALIFGLAFGMSAIFGRASCEARTVSFKSYSYGVMQGCMVETEYGRMVPLGVYREVREVSHD